MALRGIEYKIKTESHPFYKDRELKARDEETLNNLGFIAQELKDIIPEMVVYDKEYDLFTIRNYEQLFPVIVDAMQELKEEKDNEIEELRSLVNQLVEEVERLKNK